MDNGDPNSDSAGVGLLRHPNHPPNHKFRLYPLKFPSTIKDNSPLFFVKGKKEATGPALHNEEEHEEEVVEEKNAVAVVDVLYDAVMPSKSVLMVVAMIGDSVDGNGELINRLCMRNVFGVVEEGDVDEVEEEVKDKEEEDIQDEKDGEENNNMNTVTTKKKHNSNKARVHGTSSQVRDRYSPCVRRCLIGLFNDLTTSLLFCCLLPSHSPSPQNRSDSIELHRRLLRPAHWYPVP